MEAVLIAFITLLGGSGGVAVIWRAILDFRANRASREEDLTERFSKRLENRLQSEEKRNEELEDELEEERRYTLLLSITLAQNGLEIPQRGGTIHD